MLGKLEAVFMGGCQEPGARGVSWCHGGLDLGDSEVAWDHGSQQATELTGGLNSKEHSRSLELSKLMEVQNHLDLLAT